MRTWYAYASRVGTTASADEDWYHGSAVMEPFERFDFNKDQPGQERYVPKHWNSHLGTHFSSDHTTAARIAFHRSGTMYHCGLAMENPKHYRSEFDLDRSAHQWAKKNGYIPDFSSSMHPDHCENELRNHPQIKQIAEGFKQHLREQGHDGITYGNEFEGPHLHECAIAFHPDDITIKSVHHSSEPCEDGEVCRNCLYPHFKHDWGLCDHCGESYDDDDASEHYGSLTRHFADYNPNGTWDPDLKTPQTQHAEALTAHLSEHHPHLLNLPEGIRDLHHRLEHTAEGRGIGGATMLPLSHEHDPIIEPTVSRTQRVSSLTQHFASEDYRGSHQAPGPDEPGLHEVPDDFLDHPEYFGSGKPAPASRYHCTVEHESAVDSWKGTQEGHSQALRAKGKPEEPVTIYRSVPPNVEHINPGDWVTLSARYAQRHAESNLEEGRYKILKATVPAKHVNWDWGDAHEWGYNGPKIEHAEEHTDRYRPLPYHDEDGGIIRPQAAKTAEVVPFPDRPVEQKTGTDPHPYDPIGGEDGQPCAECGWGKDLFQHSPDRIAYWNSDKRLEDEARKRQQWDDEARNYGSNAPDTIRWILDKGVDSEYCQHPAHRSPSENIYTSNPRATRATHLGGGGHPLCEEHRGAFNHLRPAEQILRRDDAARAAGKSDEERYEDFLADERRRKQMRLAQRTATQESKVYHWTGETYGPDGTYVTKTFDVPGPLYHGGGKRLREGDEIRPGRKTNGWGDEGAKSSHVYFTQHLPTAAEYARASGGHVFEVEPTGEFRQDYGGGDYKTQHPLRVVRRLDPSEWQGGKTAAKDDEIEQLIDLIGGNRPSTPNPADHADLDEDERMRKIEEDWKENVRKHQEWQAKRPGVNPGDELPGVMKHYPDAEWVPIHIAQRFREHTGDQHSASEENVADIHRQLESGRGLTDPVMLLHHNEQNRATLGEGNHRLVAMERAGWTHVPMRVCRMYDSEAKRGEGKPIPHAWRNPDLTGRTPEMCKPSEVFNDVVLGAYGKPRVQRPVDGGEPTKDPGSKEATRHAEDRGEGHPGGRPGLDRRRDGQRGLGAFLRRLRAGAGGPGVGGTGPRPLTFHPKAKKEIAKLDKPSQKSVQTTIQGLQNDDPNLQTHALTGRLKGWYATKASRGHRIVHQPTDAGGIHIGAVSLHDYTEAINRLARYGNYDRDRDQNGECYYYPHVEHEHYDVGNGEIECPYSSSHTDWDSEYSHLPDEVHRGMQLPKPGEGWDRLHPHEKAQEIVRSLSDEHHDQPKATLGSHWSTSEQVARGYGDPGTQPRLGVVFHATRPEREHIVTDPEWMEDTAAFGLHMHDDAEVPIQPHAPVRVRGVSWQEDGKWHRYDFPQVQQHVAVIAAHD